MWPKLLKIGKSCVSSCLKTYFIIKSASGRCLWVIKTYTIFVPFLVKYCCRVVRKKVMGLSLKIDFFAL